MQAETSSCQLLRQGYCPDCMVATPAEADGARLCRRAASNSSVSMFLRDMGDFRVLTRRQEGRLFHIYQRGRHLDAQGDQLSADEQQVGLARA